MASPIKIRLASRAYDGTLPILRSQMGIPGFEFDITETEDVPGMFAGMFKGRYDVLDVLHSARRGMDPISLEWSIAGGEEPMA